MSCSDLKEQRQLCMVMKADCNSSRGLIATWATASLSIPLACIHIVQLSMKSSAWSLNQRRVYYLSNQMSWSSPCKKKKKHSQEHVLEAAREQLVQVRTLGPFCLMFSKSQVRMYYTATTRLPFYSSREACLGNAASFISAQDDTFAADSLGLCLIVV